MKEKVPRQQECPICKGWAFIDIELPADQGNHTTEDCGYCLGTGYIAKESISHQKFSKTRLFGCSTISWRRC